MGKQSLKCLSKNSARQLMKMLLKMSCVITHTHTNTILPQVRAVVITTKQEPRQKRSSRARWAATCRYWTFTDVSIHTFSPFITRLIIQFRTSTLQNEDTVFNTCSWKHVDASCFWKPVSDYSFCEQVSFTLLRLVVAHVVSWGQTTCRPLADTAV